MIRRASARIATMVTVGLGSLGPVWAEAPASAPPPAEVKPQAKEEKPKTLWDEFKLFSFIEMGATFSLHGGSTGIPGQTSSGATNVDRYYDINQGYTFNMAEFSIKRDPDEAFPFGAG